MPREAAGSRKRNGRNPAAAGNIAADARSKRNREESAEDAIARITAAIENEMMPVELQHPTAGGTSSEHALTNQAPAIPLPAAMLPASTTEQAVIRTQRNEDESENGGPEVFVLKAELRVAHAVLYANFYMTWTVACHALLLLLLLLL